MQSESLRQRLVTLVTPAPPGPRMETNQAEHRPSSAGEFANAMRRVLHPALAQIGGARRRPWCAPKRRRSVRPRKGLTDPHSRRLRVPDRRESRRSGRIARVGAAELVVRAGVGLLAGLILAREQ